MWNADEEMEKYLKEFKPRAIRPLTIQPVKREDLAPRFWLATIAVAAIMLAAGFSIFVSRRETVVVPQASNARPAASRAALVEKRMNTFLLTQLALEDSQAFDAFMSDESRRVLPSLQGQDSMLQILAVEQRKKHD